jgi:hypothetical protein
MLHVRLQVHSHQEGKQELVLLKQAAAHLQDTFGVAHAAKPQKQPMRFCTPEVSPA